MRNSTSPHLILASASPARLKLLRAAGIEPEVLVSGVDESTVDAEKADSLCLDLARLKAEAIVDRVRADQAAGRREIPPGTLVLGCDSVLAFDGEILGKPTDAADATARWRRMRGRSGVLHTGHCLIETAPTHAGDGGHTAGGAGGGHADRRAEAVAATVVHFADVSDAEIAAYVATGEPLQVAGAFTIDGLGGPFVERVEGDAATVVGLSLPLLRHLLGRLDVRITDLWHDPTPGGEAAPPLH
ncbi:Maf family protein [Micromonospora zhanjiangensis]|uniref:Nucleoside triphosphate pyrophosphatase n=1 Tax=Micromonospora zhanjiangensis TaxID=1522057 RepID=A0ABV8KKY6_9ACTN